MSVMETMKLGIDVGTNSVGLCALSVDASGRPLKILNSMTVIHDSGVDPEKQKPADTRLATAGTARRMRRLYRNRRKRLRQLDEKIKELGWPIINLETLNDPYAPWKIRARLAKSKLPKEELPAAMSIALRHLARHRGWRSPYERVESLHSKHDDSELFQQLKRRVSDEIGRPVDELSTPAQVICEWGLSPAKRLRNAGKTKYGSDSVKNGVSVSGDLKAGILGGKLMQSDNANEIMRIGKMQELPQHLILELIDLVFHAASPVGSASAKTKKDALPGQGKYPRASKANLEFQRFRIVQVVANLRLTESKTGEIRLLTPSEKTKIIDFLMSADETDGITWGDVAELLGVDREQLNGTAQLSPDGERASSFPPINVTQKRIIESEIKPLLTWWQTADFESKNALVQAISNAEVIDEDSPGFKQAELFLSSCGDDILTKLDGIKLPAGRAAYSEDSLKRLSDRMETDSVDLFEARKLEFGVPNDWVPPADPIGEPVGNPSVDRVTKIVNRWILAVTKKWGVPASVNIEHIRSGLMSKRQVRAYEQDVKNKREQNLRIMEEINEKITGHKYASRSDITRYLAVQRQNCQCAYCGECITYDTCEIDHIVPRKGPGSTNTRNNLVAACLRCNRAKSNTPFSVWAEECGLSAVSVDAAIERVWQWNGDAGLSVQQFKNFQKDVIARLRKRSEDDAIDNRSIESVAWMANELHHRIHAHFKQLGHDVQVNVFRGAITAEARKASGFEGKVNLIGGPGKTRLDRRHHTMDAAVIALMRPKVAQVLAERMNIRTSQRLTRSGENWKAYQGSTIEARQLYAQWLSNMDKLLDLFNFAIANDEIPVTQNVRLRLGNGNAHDASVRKPVPKHVGDSWALDEIDRVITEAAWVALTRDPDFDPGSGLPANPNREIRVKNSWLKAGDNLGLTPKKTAVIAVRGGYANVGKVIHHVRIYRYGTKSPKYGMVRVFAHDLLRDRDKNLFTVPLRESGISLRTTNAKTRKAIVDGTATYIGWLVTGAELELDLSNPYFKKGIVGSFLEDFPNTSKWVVDGFPDPDKLRLRPRQLAGEGIKNIEVSDGSKEILSGKGWRPSVDALLSKALFAHVIWRTALGGSRTKSSAGLPASFSLKN